MNQANEKIRKAIRMAGVKHWQVAAAMGIREETLTRILRFEVSPEREKQILNAVEKLKTQMIER